MCGVVAGLLLGVFWLATLLGQDTRTGPLPRGFEARLRRVFENNAPGIRALALPMNALLYAFGERRGSENVIVARSRTHGAMLFLAPELAFESGGPALERTFAQNLVALRERVRALREGGAARVLLVPVPTKASVLLTTDASLRAPLARLAPGEALPGSAFDGKRSAAAYERLAALRDLEDLEVVALQRPFVALAARQPGPIYSYEDTHWTSLGLNHAAAAVLRAWRGRQRISFVKTGRLQDEPGDLQRMLALPNRPMFRTHPLEEDVYVLRTRHRKGRCPQRVFLLGSSYSRHHEQSLAALLSRASGCPIEDLSRVGQGALASFRVLLAERSGELRDAVVIWEFPFRELAELRAFEPN